MPTLHIAAREPERRSKARLGSGSIAFAEQQLGPGRVQERRACQARRLRKGRELRQALSGAVALGDRDGTIERD